MRIGLAAAFALVAGAALAQPAGGFTQLFMSPCGEPFRANDGEPYPVHAWFAQADTDHDGSIDLAEFRADHARFFDILDQDKNGYIDGLEVSFYEKRIAPDVLLGQLYGARDPARTPPGLWGGAVVRAQFGGVGGGGYQGPGGAQGPAPDLGAARRPKQELIGSELYSLLKDPEPVTSADTNLDGRITKAEFLAAADRRFKRLDRKGDGKLTLDELPKPQAQVMAENAAKKRGKKR
jgi:hypothetical protein